MSLSAPTLRKTALFDLHERQGARIVPFAGWAMPVQYRGIVEEHRAVRARAGIFDVSHMGRLFVAGPGAAAWLRRAVTYDVAALAEGRGHYTLLCNDEGGILDDPYAYRLDGERFLFVGNAANADGDRERVAALRRAGDDAELIDRQEQTVMLAVQGPAAEAYVTRVLGAAVSTIEKRACTELPFRGTKLFVSRTGYTGEDGFELVASPDAGRALWEHFIESGVEPCGLGARDTLRLEAALPLWGNDIDEHTNPYEAGLGWVVTLDDGAEFAGRDALQRIKAGGASRKLACLQATGRGVIREGCTVLSGDDAVGTVTSGGYSPTLETSIALAYLPPALAADGMQLEVDVRGRRIDVTVVKRPFVRGGTANRAG